MKFKSFYFGLASFIILFIIASIITQSSILSHDQAKTISIITLVGLMFVAGILDGFNPCAFSTLLLWTGFLLNRFGEQVNEKDNITKKRKAILSYAIFYSLGIFLIYFILGTGIIIIGDIIDISNISLFTMIMGFFVVLLGIIMIKDAMFPGSKTIMQAPKFLYPIMRKYRETTTKIGAFLSGIVIGLCAIPCGGAIYMAIITLLYNKPFIVKYPVLFIYNIGFILPVIILALTISNRKLLTSISRDFIKSKNTIRLLIGIITILLGLLSIYLT